jgi:hypothetical protein
MEIFDLMRLEAEGYENRGTGGREGRSKGGLQRKEKEEVELLGEQRSALVTVPEEP